MAYSPNDPIARTNLSLDLLAARQQAIAGNLSNMHTPGYVRRDINFGQYLSTANGPLETQLSQRMGPCPLLEELGGEVDPAQELADLQETALFYQVATRRMSSTIQELKTAAGVGK